MEADILQSEITVIDKYISKTQITLDDQQQTIQV